MSDELTPEQKALQEEIHKKVHTLKFVRTHVRWASIVVQFLGLFMSSTPLIIWGTLGFVLTYLVSVGIMEDINLLIWDHEHEPEEEKDEKAE